MHLIDTFDAITFDEKGFIICSIHQQRRYGWRAPAPAAGKGIRYMTDLEYQQKEIFGIEPSPIVDPLDNSGRDQRPTKPDPTLVEKVIRFARVEIAKRSTNGSVPNGKAFRENLERVEAEIIERDKRALQAP